MGFAAKKTAFFQILFFFIFSGQCALRDNEKIDLGVSSEKNHLINYFYHMLQSKGFFFIYEYS